MARPADKLRAVVEVIRARIAHGSDALRGMPGERQLAIELGVSRQTVRSAIGQLEREGCLARLPNGRIGAAAGREGSARRPEIGFVRRAEGSQENAFWLNGITRAVDGRATVREVSFDHFGDPALAAALEAFDGIFLHPSRESASPWLGERLRSSRCRVAILDFDWTAYGLPSISVFPARAEWKLLEHLRDLGHRRVDCVNAQPLDPVIEARIAAWREGLAEFGLTGRLHSDPGYPAVEMAYRLMRRKLKARERSPLGTALLCVTGPAAVGTLRACADEGIAVGRDLSVVAMNDEGLGPYLTPSLTCLQSPPRENFLLSAVEWMIGRKEWQGSLWVEPKDIPMFVGESSGAALRSF
ncbi:regulatory protein, gntR family [Verrucomicrobium sp. GAS474]|uniref:substrate-binding domain-containing protein n=1 Tax=Verrucomicrobium sp. GAS474 TaxID=1882831 RepID=UPI0008797BCD|nr:substrate-binding domain-containing protein [Verrucomicrobium sp. GAS474]SDU27286.1 regulatory protein, gntR family [Verrucomicrobium sp. GAS474]